MSDVKWKMGDKAFYKDHAVHVLGHKDKHVRIQDSGREFVVDESALSAIPEDVHINQRGRIGVGSVIPKEIRSRYTQHKGVKTAGGSTAIDNNDQVAIDLRTKPLEDVYVFAAKHLAAHGVDTSVAALKERYSKLNVGMQRMNLGNLIRGAGRKLETEKKKAEAKAKRDEAKAVADAEKAKKAEAKAAEKPAVEKVQVAPGTKKVKKGAAVPA